MDPVNGTIPPSGSSPTPQANASIPLLPVTTVDVGSELRLQLQNAQYQLQLANQESNAQAKALLHQANTTLLELTRPLPEIVQGKTAQLLLLAGEVQIKLPDALMQLAAKNGISQTALQQLAARPQGYPLPMLTVSQGEMRFANGTSIAFPPQLQLPAGEYVAKVVSNNHGLQLQLSPINARLEVKLTPVANLQPAAPTQESEQLITKPEVAQTYARLIKLLEQQPQSQAQQTQSKGESAPLRETAVGLKAGLSQTVASGSKLPASVLSQSTQTVDNAPLQQPKNAPLPGTEKFSNQVLQQATQANADKPVGTSASNKVAGETAKAPELNFLQRAFNKAGAMPRAEAMTLEVKHNLAAELLKQLPALSPVPLSELTEPSQLRSELLGLTGLQLTSQQTQSQPSTQASAITTLFQLLLGVRAGNQNLSVPQRLKQYLEGLQSRSGLQTHQLASLEKSGTLDALQQMSQAVALYQQANTDNSGQCWYFMLPYYLNQRNEQLEGKFEHNNQDKDADKDKAWQLQLKFNLGMGSLLVKAQVKDSKVDLQFIGSSQALISRVSNFLPPLSQKLVQLGLTPNELNAHVAPVPATLLPGDHYLVQLKA
ncbi:flagellar hook-length control protein FliK [Shewanella algae]|uniref:flagellar hook-length control protein FliK n=1 Tax=Shewanella algae TaxID=38313 RepID=UPI0031F4FA85